MFDYDTVTKPLGVWREVFFDPRLRGLIEGKKKEDRTVIRATEIRLGFRSRRCPRSLKGVHDVSFVSTGVAKVLSGFGSKVGFCPYTGRIRQFGDSTVAFSVARLLDGRNRRHS
jgi:hypothetical protein